jgi:hypothetical protein
LDIQWVSDCYLTTNEKYSTYVMVRTSYIRWYDNGIHFVLDQQAYLDLLRNAALELWHISLIPSQQVIARSNYRCVLIREAINANFIIFCLVQVGFEHIIDHIRDEHANPNTPMCSWVFTRKQKILKFVV